jgi:hypothetical protein
MTDQGSSKFSGFSPSHTTPGLHDVLQEASGSLRKRGATGQFKATTITPTSALPIQQQQLCSEVCVCVCVCVCVLGFFSFSFIK